MTKDRYMALADFQELWSNKIKPTVARNEMETVSGSSVSKQLSPNKFYSFGTVASLTITLATPTANIPNEYLFEFDSGSTATTLTLPASVLGVDATEIEAGMHYEVSIKYTTQGGGKYYGLIASW